MSLQFLSRGLSRQLIPTTRLVQNRVPAVATTAIRTFASKKVRLEDFVCQLLDFLLTCFQHKNLLKHAKGFRGRSKNCFRVAIRRVQKSWQYAYRDRKRKKREWHKLWIQRISAGVRQYSWRYSEFFGAYRKSGLQMDRKVLAELAATEPFAFRSVVQVVENQSTIAK